MPSPAPSTLPLLNATDVVATFTQAFGAPELVVRSPGRVNLIGEHTDYNMGFVLPGAISKEIYLALRRRPGTAARVLALNIDARADFDLNNLKPSGRHWSNYLKGIVHMLQQRGLEVGGFDLAVGGNLPLGSGISSSAALECGLLFALNELFGFKLDRLAMARLAQASENDFVGVKCGIMDQFANLFGEPDTLLRLDCRSLQAERCHFQRDGYDVVLLHTGVQHTLGSSEYNLRRAQCEQAVIALQARHPEVHSLRDATPEMVEANRPRMDKTIYRRALYVTQENRRVLQATDALKTEDWATFGKLMYASHEGLRDLYEVSCPELDILVEEASKDPGVCGARMMGGGFGGATINLMARDGLADRLARIQNVYAKATGREARFIACRVVAGTSVLDSKIK